MYSDKLVSTLLNENVTGDLTRQFHEYKNEKNFSQQYNKFLQLIVSETNDHPMEKEQQEDPYKVKEAAIYYLASLCVRQESLSTTERLVKKMLEDIRPFFIALPKARTAKIVRNFIDVIADAQNTLEIQEQLCLETIQWCIDEKRMFLRHRVQVRLAIVYHQLARFTDALNLIEKLLPEVKRLDDKLLLVEIHYIESKLYFFTNNLSKSKAALTAARSNANAIHCPPLLHADIDIMSGAIHCEEGDSKTAFSYFFEAFEAFNISNEGKASTALKYMMLAKLIALRPKDVLSMTTQRTYLKYRGRDITALRDIAQSCIDENLQAFKNTLDLYQKEICEDPIISRHTHKLYENLLRDNILKVLKPYHRVEISHVAYLMDLPVDLIQSKLNKMTLDHQLHATLDQEQGIVTVYNEPQTPILYTDTMAIFENLSTTVDLLHQKAQSVL